MSEKFYQLLLKFYPDHFRRGYGEEALRFVRDRARSEKGFLAGLRLWLGLLLDLAISLPREYSHAPTTPIVAAQPLNGERSFQLQATRPPTAALLCLGGTLSAVLFCLCAIVVTQRSATRFPALFPVPRLQKLAQSTLDSSGYSMSTGPYSFCMTAKRDIPGNSVQPLVAFHFASPGASGVALIDGKVVSRFNNEQHLSIRAHVFPGDHQLVLHLDKPAGETFMSSNRDFGYCQPKSN